MVIKLPKLWRNGPTGDWHIYLGKRKVNLRTKDATEADRLRRKLRTGELTPEAIPGAPRLLETFELPVGTTPQKTETDPVGAAAGALRDVFERIDPPPPPTGASPPPTAGPTAPDAVRNPPPAGEWHELGATATATEPEADPTVNFDTAELLDFAASAICDLTELAARAVLAKRNRLPMVLDEKFPLKPLLRDSWAAQLRILIPTGAPLTPAAGIAIGTFGVWFAMVAGSQPMSPAEVAERERAAREKAEATEPKAA